MRWNPDLHQSTVYRPYWLGALRPYDELDVAIENPEQSKQLVDGLPIIRLIKKSVELGWGRAEPPDDFALGQRRGGDSLLSFESQLVQKEISQVVGILIVFENVLDVHRSLATGL